MGEAKAREVRSERLEKVREGEVNERTYMLAALAAFVWRKDVESAGAEKAVDVAAQILDAARSRAEQDIPRPIR